MFLIKMLASFLLLGTILPSINVDAQTPGCGGTYSGLSGTISSPNYPSNYGNNLNCSYYIQISPPNYVNITFMSFETQLSLDWLQVACSSDPIIPVRRFNGSALPSPLSIPPCSTVLLQFHTDGSVTFQGFRLIYNIYNGCGGTYSNPSGIISSPNYPSTYSNNLNCSYYIQSPPSNSVNIVFISFATESGFDYLEVSCASDSTKRVQRFKGTDLPPFLSISSCYNVQLLFHTDYSVVAQGFSLRYDIGTDCGGTYTSLSGTISSPNYPSNYSDYLNCSYFIQLSPANSVNITFISFDTESGFDYLEVSCASDSTKPVQRFSGSDLPPFLLIRSCYNVKLLFHTDGSVVAQGFSLRYDIGTGCGGTYTNLSGTISSPNYPSSYSDYLNCSYYIQLSPANSVNITFISFDTESGFDWLQVICAGGSPKAVPKFDGSNLPPFLSLSSCSRVQLLFYTDGSVVRTGFSLRYYIGYGLQGGLTMKPMNLNVRSDSTEPIVLSCSSRANQPDVYPWWSYISNDYYPYAKILTTSNCSVSSSLRSLNSSFFSTTRQYSSRTCNLTISRFYFTSTTGIGLYTCTDSTLDFFNARITFAVPSFKIVNLDSATEVVRNDRMYVTCSVEVYQATSSIPQLVPSIYLYSGDNRNPIIVSNSTISLIVLAIPEILPPYDCKINFTYSRNFPTGYATNMPQNISLTTQARQVLYWPENKTILIVGDNNGKVAANGNLTCFVPANPPVTYQWTNDVETRLLWRGSTVTVEHSGTYTCTATNIIRGKTYEASNSINITIINETGNNNLNTLALIVGVVVGIVVLLIVVAIVVFFCLRRKKMHETPNPPTPTYVDPWNDTLYEMTRRGTLCVDGSDNNAYEPITSKTRDTA